MELKKLFEPIKIGPVEIKNRIVLAPMNVHMANADGSVSEQELCYYAARAKGGVGLIVYGCVLSSRRAWEQHGLMIDSLFDPGRHATGVCDLAETIHYWGAKSFIQLSPGFGRQQRYWRTPLYSASAGIPMNAEKVMDSTPDIMKPFMRIRPKPRAPFNNVPREMTVSEIKQDVEDFIKAAELAIIAGFDGIEIHSPHGYLLHQFLSPRTNKRTDMYGGSLENRARFLIEIITALRKEFGPSLPISTRLSGAEHVEGGFSEEDVREYAKMAVQAGANCIHLSDGCFEAFRYFFPEKENVHILEEQGKKLKNAANVPIISFSIHDPELAEKAIQEGQTDMVSAGRQFLADPEWPNKAKEGRVKDIVRCQRDYACLISLYREGAIRCILNPNLGRERYMPEYWPQRRPANIPETLARIHNLIKDIVKAPCADVCPAGIDVPRYNRCIAKGKPAEAVAVIREKIPFPSVCGYVCDHPCETLCKRGEHLDEAIAIRALKRFAAEHDDGLWKQKSKVAPATSKRVAIVGSGPAGLTAAYYLAKLGHAVTVFEALAEPGGMMRVGIPDYRLPKDILKAEIEEIKSVGVDIKTNTTVDSPQKLLEQGYNAVLLAIGAHQGMKIGVKGEDSPQVKDCISFLRDVNLGVKVKLGDRVAVIGGGNAAIDSARTALRLGAKEVTIVYRRTQAEMPASSEEIEGALTEGVKIQFLSAPSRIISQDGKLELECIRMELGQSYASGRPEPVPIKGSEFNMSFDTIIAAIGQQPEVPEQFGLSLSRGNTITVEPNTLAMGIEGIFAGGDVVSGPASVIKAIAAGRQASISIDKHLGGSGDIDETLAPPEEEGLVPTPLRDIEEKPRVSIPTLPVAQRLTGFAEVELSLSEEMAIEEAERCLWCDLREEE